VKRDWLEGLITDPSTSIWDLAKWCNGHCSPWIPPINGSSDPEEMGEAFKERFFSFPQPPEPVLNLPGTPAPKWPFYAVTKSEVEHTIQGTSNKSAPSPSGIGYKLVKWVFAAHPDFILDIYNTAICLSHHPWTIAKIVILPKPNKLNYSAAKAYCLVSLLECFGKVLEKIVANRFTSDSNLHDILPQSQFGSRPCHSATDACTLLRYKASTTINSRRIGGTLLFDISHFFDHLNPSFTARILHHLGIDNHTIAWVRDFMTRQQVSMSFNNYTTGTLELDLGTPQGSPLSPILSALVTGPILCLAESWDNANLTLYIDDGNIFTSGPTYQATADKVSKAAKQVFTWLHDSGFSIDTKKCELMFFHHWITHDATYGTAPTTVTLQFPDMSQVTIKPSMSIRYLGVFFTPCLDWTCYRYLCRVTVNSMRRAKSH
jgi:hypothetical protein